MGGIPLGGIPVGTPLGGIPLGGIDLTGTPLGGIPLGGINMSVSPLGGIPLGGIPLSAKNAILNCPTGNFICAPTDTLGAAHAAGAIKSTATLQDLGYYKNASGQDITLAELVVGLPADTTLEDLLATVLLRTAYDWEALPLQTFPLQDFSSDGATADYSVSFTVTDVGADVDGSVGVHLPPQARYVPDSTQLSGGPGIAAGEPTLLPAENELTWAVTGIDSRHDLHPRLPGEARPAPRHRVGDGGDRRHRPGRHRCSRRTRPAPRSPSPASPRTATRNPRRRFRTTRSTSATRRAARTRTSSRSRPLRASS